MYPSNGDDQKADSVFETGLDDCATKARAGGTVRTSHHVFRTVDIKQRGTIT